MNLITFLCDSYPGWIITAANFYPQRGACVYFRSANGAAEGKQSQCVLSLSPEVALNGCHAASQVLIGVVL